MSIPDSVMVIRIPCDKASPISRVELSLTKLDSGSTNKDEWKDFEKKLGWIPDLQSYKGLKDFRWSHRSFVGYSAKDTRWIDSYRKHYMMYLCVDARADLPQNGFLSEMREKASQKGKYRLPPMLVYGDAFFFTKEPVAVGCDEPERPAYIDMGGEVDAKGITNSQYIECVLCKLLTFPRDGILEEFTASGEQQSM